MPRSYQDPHWDPNQDPTCRFCGRAPETWDHLIQTCTRVRRFLRSVAARHALRPADLFLFWAQSPNVPWGRAQHVTTLLLPHRRTFWTVFRGQLPLDALQP